MSNETTQYELGSTALFQPIKVGNKTLANRVVYPPTTRRRATIDGTPTDLMYEYYGRRAKNNGGLIIVEGTFISAEASGLSYAPGIYSEAQIKSWKKIVDKIHENGTVASVQLWNLGRTADPVEMKRLGVPLVAPSAIYFDKASEERAIKEGLPLRALTLKEIDDYKQMYLKAAKNAVDGAGFDFIELHDAHGYFLDQFLNPSSNQRTDKYGGSIENRARLVLEIIDLLIPAIGNDKIGIRVSPWATFQGMKAENEEVHPIAQIGYLLSELEKRKIAYVSVVEPRVSGAQDVSQAAWGDKSNDFVYQIYKGTVIRSGNYLGDRADGFKYLKRDLAKNDRTMFGFSRFFTSTPDLVERLKKGLELTKYDRPHFYTRGNYHYDTFRGYGEADVSENDEQAGRLPIAIVSKL